MAMGTLICFNCCLTEQPQPQRRRRLDRTMIGQPTDFRHTAHVGSGDVMTNGSSANKLTDVQDQMQSKGGYEHLTDVQDQMQSKGVYEHLTDVQDQMQSKGGYEHVSPVGIQLNVIDLPARNNS